MSIRYLSGINVDSNTLFVDSANDRVGIGTASPAFKLDVSGTFHSGGDATFNGTNTYINSSYIYVGNNTADLVSISGNTMYFPGNGNVGIGTTSPASLLHIYGSGNTFTRYTNTTSAGHYIDIGANSAGQSFIYGYGAYPLLFATNGSEAMRIASGGNVGVGNTNPEAKLHVSGLKSILSNYGVGSSQFFTYEIVTGTSSSTNQTFDMYMGRFGNGYHRVVLWGSGYGTDVGNYFDITRSWGTGSAPRIISNGGLYIGGATYTIHWEAVSYGQYDLFIKWTANMPAGYSNTISYAIQSNTGSGYTQFDYPSGVTVPTLNSSNLVDSVLTAAYNTGNVGIGTTSPTARLHVSGGDGIINNAFIGEVPTYTSANAQFSHTSRAGAGEYSFLSANDGETFINSKTGTNIRFRVNNSDKVIINSAGNVGIGTTNPYESLDVVGNIRIGNYTTAGTRYIGYANNTFGNQFIAGMSIESTTLGGNYSQKLNFATHYYGVSAGVRMTIDEAGNVGIGTTTPSHKLDVEGNIRAKSATFYIGTTSTNYLASNNTDVYLRTNAIHYFEGNNFFKGVWDASGNLGIGTTSPSSKLHVEGAGLIATIKNSSAGADEYSQLEFAAGNRRGYIWLGNENTSSWAGAGGLNIYTSNGNMDLWTNNVQRVRIDTSGNVGIGTTAPAYKLDVVGNGRFSSLLQVNGPGGEGRTDFQGINLFNGNNDYRIALDSQVGTRGYIRYNVDTAGSTIHGHIFSAGDYNSSVTDLMLIRADGNVGIGTTAPNQILSVEGGNIQLNANNAAANYYLFLNKKTGQDGGIIFNRDNNNDWQLTNHSSLGDLVFYSYGTASEAITFKKGTGNVGIGTTAPNAKLDVAGGINTRNTRVNSAEKYPVGHYSFGETVFEIDPTWTEAQLQDFFNVSGVSWVADSTAPGGYAIQIDGSANVGAGEYDSGFPYIPVDNSQDDWYYMECYIKNDAGSSIQHYMGGIDFNQNFASLGGNPGSYTYNVMFNYNPGTSWTKVYGYWNGFGSSYGSAGTGNTNNWVSGTKYFTPQALFNYGLNSGIRRCYISGWKCVRVRATGNRYYSNNVLVSGNVGIGTTAPDAKLVVTGDGSGTAKIGPAGFGGNYTGISLNGTLNTVSYNFLSSTSDNHLYINRPAGNDIYFRLANNDQVAIKASGNVGIGTTAPTTLLQVASSQTNSSIRTGGLEMQSYAVNNSWYAENVYFDGSSWRLRSNGYATQMYMQGGTIDFNRVATGAAGDAATLLTTIRLNNTGNVLIGTTTDNGYKLRVNGKGYFDNNVVIAPTSESWAEGLSFVMPTTGTWGGLRWRRERVGSDGNWYIGYTGLDNTDDLVFGANNGGTQVDNIIRLTKAGNVGIGTTAPTWKLQTESSSSTVAMFRSSDSNTIVGIDNSAVDGDPQLKFYINDIGTFTLGVDDSDSDKFKIGTSDLTTNTRLTIDGSGNVGIGTTAPEKLLHISGGSGNVDNLILESAYVSAGVGVAMQFNRSSGVLARIRGIEEGAWNGGLLFEVRSGNTYPGYNGATDVAMKIATNGNVGIGTTAPTARLTIGANTSVQSTNGIALGAGETSLEFVHSTFQNGFGSKLYSVDSGGGITSLRIATRPNSTSWSDAVTIIAGTSGNGNVGIGTTAPSEKLELSASGNIYGKIISTTTGGNAGVRFLSTGAREYGIFTDGDLRFYDFSASAERMRITGAGNVGIGTTAPSSKLHIYQSNSEGIYLDGLQEYTTFKMLYGGNQKAEVVYQYSADQMYFNKFGTGTFAFYGGNVGIGASSPTEQLHVGGNVIVTYNNSYQGINSVGNKAILARVSPTTGIINYAEYATATNLNGFVMGSDDARVKGNIATDSLEFITNTSTRMTILSNGDVGINNTNPSRKLDVTGEARVVSTSNLAMFIKTSSGFGAGISYEDSTTGGNDVVYAGAIGAAFFIATGAAERVRVLSGGNVGIATNNPLSRLHVVGDARIASGSLGVGVAPNATDGRVDASNDIVAYSTSDQRLKENVMPIENALEKVKTLTGVEFDWKEKTAHVHGYHGHDVGIIAQDVQAVLPEAVRTNESGYLSVRYEKMIALLIEANKELAARVEELEKKLK